MNEGIVYLAGAGPGDPKLITQKSIDCLRKADVVIYDRLIDKRLLEFVPKKACKLYVGKKPQKHEIEQIEINRLMVENARKGKLVVRLKGGDPFVFGRGGEEAMVLASEGIRFEIIPGVSSAIAVPAYAGIPVTHRGIASSFQVITGNKDSNRDMSSVDFRKTSSADTLIILMGMENLTKILKMLIKCGRSGDTPVAVIYKGTTSEQITVVGCLENVENKIRGKRISSPAVIIVGEVVNLRNKLAWFDKRPFSGKRILVTRAKHQARALCDLLEEKGAVPVTLPVIQIEPAVGNFPKLDKAISELNKYDWLLFTSENGVALFFDYLYKKNLDARTLKINKIGAIGPATANILKMRGIIPDFIPAEYSSRGIIKEFKKIDIEKNRFLILGSDRADNELSDGLHKYGAKVNLLSIYHTQLVKPVVESNIIINCLNDIDLITFTSASTVMGLIKMIPDKVPLINKTRIACIGQKTAQAARRAGLRVDVIAEEHSINGLVAAIELFFKGEMNGAVP